MEKTFRNPRQVLVYCFRHVNDDLQYLMLRRVPKYGGFWQGVTGAPEGSETLSEAAARELQEETRLHPLQIHQVDFSYSFAVQNEWRWAYEPRVQKIDEYVFVAEIPDGETPTLSFEHDAYEWATFARAMGLLKWPSNCAALEYCYVHYHRRIEDKQYEQNAG